MDAPAGRLRARLLAALHRNRGVELTGRVLARVLPFFARSPLGARFFDLWQEHGFHLTPVHYYQPIPDTRALPAELWSRLSELPGVEPNDELQLWLLREVFPRFRAEYERIPLAPTAVPHAFYLDNPAFNGMDALALYCIVRHFRPRLVLEVGSGHSSRLIAEAAARNGGAELVCIDPEPGPELRAGFPGLTALVPRPVQELGLEPFARLRAGDILFVDSSHVVRCGSDVNFLVLEVLPRLAPGVLVHFHDVFLPAEMPEQWIKELHLFWNEQYLLHAFLLHNAAFEVVLANAYLTHRYPAALQAAFPTSPSVGGGSLWLRRRSPESL